MPREWKRLEAELVLDLGIIRLRRDTYELASAHPFHVFESNPWVNVVPVTDAGEVVLVRQYRHGILGPSLEVPGGVVDARDASPRAAAERELLEETGYTALRWTSMGFSVLRGPSFPASPPRARGLSTIRARPAPAVLVSAHPENLRLSSARRAAPLPPSGRRYRSPR